LAHSGTIFLDEIREPSRGNSDWHCFECSRSANLNEWGVAASFPLSSNHRATNATCGSHYAGHFRADLFYRLNVFPITCRSSEPKETFRCWWKYFVKRYAGEGAKANRQDRQNTLKLCQSYPWPGNIREMQKFVERSVILCSGIPFVSIGLAFKSGRTSLGVIGPLIQTVQNYEKALIEAALAGSNGKLRGQNGAAAKTGNAAIVARIKNQTAQHKEAHHRVSSR